MTQINFRLEESHSRMRLDLVTLYYHLKGGPLNMMTMQSTYEHFLEGGDLRSIGNSNAVVDTVKDQYDFDKLFKCLFHTSRMVVMRAADAVEKITISHPSYLTKYKKRVLELASHAQDKELQWHLALLIPRLHLRNREFNYAWDILTWWATDKLNSKIVRVNSIQGLYELTHQRSDRIGDLIMVLLELKRENIPSLTARIKKIRKQIVHDH